MKNKHGLYFIESLFIAIRDINKKDENSLEK